MGPQNIARGEHIKATKSEVKKWYREINKGIIVLRFSKKLLSCGKRRYIKDVTSTPLWKTIEDHKLPN